MKICIYIPVTRVDYLDETFSSVLKQSSRDYCVLVMDNTVNSHEYVLSKFKEYFNDKCDAKIIKTPYHLGDGDPTQSWNYGLKHIDTNYFTLLGDDDALAPNYVEEMNKLMTSHSGAPIYRCRVDMINEEGLVTKYGQKLPFEISWDEYIYNRKVYKHIQSTSEFCINTEAIKSLDGYLSYPYAICSDDATYITLMLSGEMFSTNMTQAYWRRHGNNLSMRVPYKIRIAAIQKYYDYVQDLFKNNLHRLEKDLVLQTVAVNNTKEKLLVLKNKLYGWSVFRPFIYKLYSKKLINSI